MYVYSRHLVLDLVAQIEMISFFKTTTLFVRHGLLPYQPDECKGGSAVMNVGVAIIPP